MGSGTGVGKPRWNVFDGFKVIPSAPEALMAEINSAVSSFEYSKATKLLQSPSSPQSKNKSTADSNSTSQYDARMADEAYKAGLASLAAGKLDEAITTLNIALSKCPLIRPLLLLSFNPSFLSRLTNFRNLQPDFIDLENPKNE